MKLLFQLQSWFRALFQKPKLDTQMDEEMRAHIDLRMQENIRAGMNSTKARYAALRQFGWAESIKETCRERRGLKWLENLAQDIRYGARQLRRNPGFTTVALLTLALGIGATTAIVSMVKTTVFDPLPARHPARLVQIGYRDKERGWSPGFNPSGLRETRLQTNLFARVAAYSWDVLTLPGEDFPRPVRGGWVTPEFFDLWNLRPRLGRAFTADEGRPGKDAVLVISHHLWMRMFGGDPAIIGRTIPFREGPMTVVGVMPPHFSFPDAEFEYWRPAEGPVPGTDEYLPNMRVIAEMRPEVDRAQVQAFLAVLTQRQGHEFTAGNPSWYPFQIRLLRDMFSTPELRRSLGLLLGAIMFVLLIAAANVANLQLVRTESRQQELAVRAALGASRARVFRQLLTESLLLAVLGATAGIAVTVLGLDLLPKLIPANLPRLKPIALNFEVLGISAGLTLATGLLFGLAPAWPGARSNLSDVLQLNATTATRDRRCGWFSRGLIAGQITLVFVLLTGAGLMVRSVFGLLRVNPGLDPQHVVRVYPSIQGFQRGLYSPDPAKDKATDAAFAFYANARQRLAAIPGVVAAGVAFEGPETEVSTAPGALPARLMNFWIGVEAADPLRVMRVPLRQGRWLERGDGGEGVGRVVVNETAARRLWPGETGVGKRFWRKEHNVEVPCEVVGVVGDTRDWSRQVEPEPIFYRALRKEQNIDTAPKFLVIRTAANPSALYKPMGRALKDAGVDETMSEFYVLREVLDTAMTGHRIVMLCLSIFGGVGLLLAAIGLYGVLAYSVARRTREIGIRMALGAQIADVLRLTMGNGLWLVGVGGMLGLALSLATGRVLRSYLFGLNSADPATFIAVSLLLTSAALLACWLPARRAARVNPTEALRHE